MTDLARFEVSVVSDGAGMGESTRFEVILLRLAGEIDIGTSPDLRRTLESLLPSQNTLVLDMENVEFIDASGIGVLLEAASQARAAGGGMLVRRPSRRVARVMELLQLDGALPVVR